MKTASVLFSAWIVQENGVPASDRSIDVPSDRNKKTNKSDAVDDTNELFKQSLNPRSL